MKKWTVTIVFNSGDSEKIVIEETYPEVAKFDALGRIKHRGGRNQIHTIKSVAVEPLQTKE